MHNAEETLLVNGGNGMEDEELAAKMKEGDERALEKLIARHTPLMRTIIGRILNNDTDIDDLIGEAMLEVWKKIHEYDPDQGKLLGWMVTLVRRRAIDRLRRKMAYLRATGRLEEETAWETPDPRSFGAIEVPSKDKDRHRRLLELLHGIRIPDAQRECLILHFFEELSQRDIAATLNLPLGTVKTRLELGFRAISTLVLTDRFFKEEAQKAIARYKKA